MVRFMLFFIRVQRSKRHAVNRRFVQKFANRVSF